MEDRARSRSRRSTSAAKTNGKAPKDADRNRAIREWAAARDMPCLPAAVSPRRSSTRSTRPSNRITSTENSTQVAPLRWVQDNITAFGGILTTSPCSGSSPVGAALRHFSRCPKRRSLHTCDRSKRAGLSDGASDWCESCARPDNLTMLDAVTFSRGSRALELSPEYPSLRHKPLSILVTVSALADERPFAISPARSSTAKCRTTSPEIAKASAKQCFSPLHHTAKRIEDDNDDMVDTANHYRY